MGIIRDHKTPYKILDTCHECGDKFKRGEAKTTIEIYDDPWATKPCTVRVHTGNDDGNGDCFDKLTDKSWASFRYQQCPICERMIVSQCLDNGWRTFFKEVGSEEICVKCYQDMRLADGEPEEAFKRGCIGGDFFDSRELSSHGWSLVPGYHGAFIDGRESAKRFCATALELIRSGHKVLVDIYTMAIGGGEGYFSLYCKTSNQEEAHG